MTSVECPTWRNPRILLPLVLVFLAGSTVGMLVMSLGVHRVLHHRSSIQPVWREVGKEASLQRFKKELNLTPTQTEQLEMVLDDFFMYYHTLQSQLDDVRANGKKRILKILDPEQRRKFERLMSDLQDKPLR